MDEIIEHSGVVVSSQGSDDKGAGSADRDVAGKVCVKITSESACGSCKAREACGLAESTEKIIEVYTAHAAEFKAGDRVMVGVRRNTGLWSVAVAYGGALAVLLVVLAAASAAGVGEGLSALAAIAGVLVYYIVLWYFRKNIEQKIQFTITKQ